ncbi:hypothetical protein RvY_06494 [Ramazzottius varieornatus]|uniref:Uncharacterized protein n=1 Tax=Ramazzottius varieornatus TaxID=947166 RepID=A0A1D1V522_RAMVA|nr:hypothetical protein RvY_06494 [Ramazzottius varieornatus]
MVNCLKEYDSRPKRGETYKSKKEASKEFQRLINGLSSLLKEDPGAETPALLVLHRVASDILGMDPSRPTEKETRSLSRRIGLAVKEVFSHDKDVHGTRQLTRNGPRHYVGLSLL